MRTPSQGETQSKVKLCPFAPQKWRRAKPHFVKFLKKLPEVLTNQGPAGHVDEVSNIYLQGWEVECWIMGNEFGPKWMHSVV